MGKELKFFAIRDSKETIEDIVNASNKITQYERTIIQKILESLKIKKPILKEPGKLTATTFSDGEIRVGIGETARGDRAYLLANIYNPEKNRSVNDNIMEMMFAIDALQRAGAKVNVIMPYFPYARQDRDNGREGVSVGVIGNMIQNSGVKNVITFDIHNEQSLTSLFTPDRCKFLNLRASNFLIPAIMEYHTQVMGRDIKDLIVIPPDEGGSKRARKYAEIMGTDLGSAIKFRDTTSSELRELQIFGNIKDKYILIIDDMISSGGTTITAAEKALEAGAKGVYSACTHLLMPDEESAVKKLNVSPLEFILATNTIPRPEEFFQANPKFGHVNITPLIAMAAKSIFSASSLSLLYKDRHGAEMYSKFKDYHTLSWK